MVDRLKESPSQTAGPYVHIGLAPKAAGFDIYDREPAWDIAGPDAEGERVRVEGVVFDGNGAPVKDVLIEVWQADAAGHYASAEGGASPGFRGWGRAISDFATGTWGFDTIKPGPTPDARGASQAPHLKLWMVARGINIGLSTRMYFSDETEANARDPVLVMPALAARASTLIARREMRGNQVVYRFDIRLQGAGETVFFDI